jgi:2-iminobutanoate/2-iminopropanoate deaminase
MRNPIMVADAVKPAGQYSHAVVANGFAYVSGQGPADPRTNVVPDAFSDQVRQTLQNLQAILRGVGAELKDVVKVNTYLSDVTRFREYNEIYCEFFPDAPPARTTVGSQLVGIQVEIDCVAVLPNS